MHKARRWQLIMIWPNFIGNGKQDLIAKKADREEVLEMIKSSKANAGQVEVFQSSFSLRVILKFTISVWESIANLWNKIKNYLVNVAYRRKISCPCSGGLWQTLDSLYKELKEKLNTLGSSVTALVSIRTMLKLAPVHYVFTRRNTKSSRQWLVKVPYSSIPNDFSCKLRALIVSLLLMGH